MNARLFLFLQISMSVCVCVCESIRLCTFVSIGQGPLQIPHFIGSWWLSIFTGVEIYIHRFRA